MIGNTPRVPSVESFPPTRRLMAIAVAGLGFCGMAGAQVPYRSQAGEKFLFESAGASRVVEKVRAESEGTVVRVFVKPGDSVVKGQVLGHLELDAAKHKLNLARHAVESRSSVDAALAQADSWTVTREEIELQVRKRSLEQSRLEWATAMERMYRANFEQKLEDEKAQKLEFEFSEDQFEKRHFRAPVDGIVTEVLVEVGKRVSIASHGFTISNDNAFSLPLIVPDAIADAAVSEKVLPVRTSDGKSVGEAKVDSVTDDPKSTGSKIVRLLIKAADFPLVTRNKLMGMKFDVLLPQVALEDAR
jgi:multidrug efflux pump subunit AcrA (membrane-fusion protein)